MSMLSKSIQKMLLQVILIEVLLAAATSAQTTTISAPPPPPAADEIPAVKPGCPDKCGNLSIPYPFGTNKDCYLDESFLITCNDTHYDPPQPFLGRSTTIEVTDISVDEGKLNIMLAASYRCYNQSGVITDSLRNSITLNMTNYFLSDTGNKFVAVGCDTYGILRGDKGDTYGYSGGCRTECRRIDYVVNNSCSGIGCCQTSIPNGINNFQIRARSFYNHTEVWNFNPCSYAFVVQNGKLNFTSDMFTDLRGKQTFPVALDWSIGNETCSKVLEDPKKKNYRCQGNTTCLDVENGFGYRCECNDGYDGNPYLSDCLDIDECANPELNKCNQGYCINKKGTYTCSCKKGYHGDGRSDGNGCTPNRTLVIQITIGISVGLVCLLIGSSWLYLGYQRWKLIKLKEKFFKRNGGLLLQQQLSERQGPTREITKIFTAEELVKATNNYHETKVIGKGGFGTVYRGVLADGRVVAIKKSKLVDQNQIEQFINEVLVLSQINHRNVVKLLGCCFETEVPLLVYEFVTNGTLFDYIHNTSKASRPNPPWEIRLRIAAETAGVLSYLHSEASIPIIHRDVKPTNILLDENLTAKVSDFGASRLVPLDVAELSTMVKGTFGYLDPEYLQTNQLTEKSDVYSFGVVLVELLTRKKALSFDKPEDERNLAMYFLSALKDDRLLLVVDDCIVNEGNIKQLKEVSNLAKRCLRVKGEERPTMMEVAMELEGLRRMVMHPWVNVESKLEETESLLSEISMETISYGGGGDSSYGYDTMKNHIITPVNGGR